MRLGPRARARATSATDTATGTASVSSKTTITSAVITAAAISRGVTGCHTQSQVSSCRTTTVWSVSRLRRHASVTAVDEASRGGTVAVAVVGVHGMALLCVTPTCLGIVTVPIARPA